MNANESSLRQPVLQNFKQDDYRENTGQQVETASRYHVARAMNALEYQGSIAQF